MCVCIIVLANDICSGSGVNGVVIDEGGGGAIGKSELNRTVDKWLLFVIHKLNLN